MLKRKSYTVITHSHLCLIHGHCALTSVSERQPMTAMAFASHAVSKSDVDLELHLFNKS